MGKERENGHLLPTHAIGLSEKDLRKQLGWPLAQASDIGGRSADEASLDSPPFDKSLVRLSFRGLTFIYAEKEMGFPYAPMPPGRTAFEKWASPYS